MASSFTAMVSTKMANTKRKGPKWTPKRPQNGNVTTYRGAVWTRPTALELARRGTGGAW